MIIVFDPMEEPAACEIVRWRYASPYDVYNLEDSISSIRYALDPQNNFYMMRTNDDGLVGFCSFGKDGQVPGGDYRTDALDIGMGVRPDLTGKGHGSQIAAAVLKFARKRFQPTVYRVTIAAFNQRARRVWEKIGFREIQNFTHLESQREFIVMMLRDRVQG